VLIEFTYSLYQRHSRESGNPENTSRLEQVLLYSRFRGNDGQRLCCYSFFHFCFVAVLVTCVLSLSITTYFRSGYGIEIPTHIFRIPTGFHIIAQGCGTPLPWVSDFSPSPSVLLQRSYVSLPMEHSHPNMTQPRWGKWELWAISIPG